jgi:ribosomal subunit interface protein
MKIRVRETNKKINTGLYSFLEKKIKTLEKLLPNIPDLIVEVEVGLTTQHHQKGDIYKSEIQIQLGQKLLRSVSKKDNLKSAIIESVEDLEGQLRKRKDTFIAKRKIK